MRNFVVSGIFWPGSASSLLSLKTSRYNAWPCLQKNKIKGKGTAQLMYKKERVFLSISLFPPFKIHTLCRLLLLFRLSTQFILSNPFLQVHRYINSDVIAVERKQSHFSTTGNVKDPADAWILNLEQAIDRLWCRRRNIDPPPQKEWVRIQKHRNLA